MTVLVAIVGGSGSGKSTLARALVARRPGAAVLIEEDRYYGDWGAAPGFDPARFDFDDVAARDHALLASQLTELRAGRAVEAPLYDFATHRRLPATEALAPAPLVVVEGAHLLCTPAVAALFDLKVFVDTPADVRFIRRLLRDQAERGRTAESVIAQYLATVRPAHQRWVAPTRSLADLIIADQAGATSAPDPVAVAALLAPVLVHPALQGVL